MKDLVIWLQGVEELACDIYHDAAGCFRDDPHFAAFLNTLSEDEDWHYHLVGNALDALESMDDVPKPALLIDPETRRHVEDSLRRVGELAHVATPSRTTVLEAVVAAETSELNDIFLYVLHTANPHVKAFQRVASNVQQHEDRIRDFIGSLPADERPPADIGVLPHVWEGQLLLVDDDATIRMVLQHALGKFGRLQVAENGREALEHVKRSHFNFIISDVDMPEMTGTEFYEAALAEDATVAGRFLLMSGRPRGELASFCEKHHLPFLPKPFALQNLIKEVDRLLQA